MLIIRCLGSGCLWQRNSQKLARVLSVCLPWPPWARTPRSTDFKHRSQPPGSQGRPRRNSRPVRTGVSALFALRGFKEQMQKQSTGRWGPWLPTSAPRGSRGPCLSLLNPLSLARDTAARPLGTEAAAVEGS